MTAFEILTANLAALQADGESVSPDELGDGLEQVVDFKLIGTRRTRTVRLDVWRDPKTDTHAGVRYQHHDDYGSDGCTPEIVNVQLVTRPTWVVVK